MDKITTTWNQAPIVGFIILVALTASSCGGGGSSSVGQSEWVTIPSSNANRVPVDTLVSASYKDALNPGTASILLTGPGGSESGAVNIIGNTATFTPSTSLDFSTTYTATVSTGGAGPSSSHAWNFTT